MEVFLGLIGLLLVLIIAGVPISFALMSAGILGIILQRGWTGMQFILGNAPYSSTASLGLIIVPLFLFMGHMAFSAGISERAFNVARQWLGHITGGLAMATIAACAAFATVSGSSIATAATIAKVAVPEMLRSGYNQRLAAGCAAAGGTLGVLIPPSGVLVIYAIICNLPLPKLFAAALVPGILTAIAYAVAVHFAVRFDPVQRNATRMPRVPMGQRIWALSSFWEVALLFGIVMGGLYSGLATATESAVLGAAAALMIALFRKGNRSQILWDGLVTTGAATSSIFLLLIGASLFGTAMATTQVPQQLAVAFSALDLPIPVMTFLLLIPFLILGCLIDGYSMILLLMPIIFPILQSLEINPILFGILVTKTTEVGALTPPVGLNVFVVQNVVPQLQLGEIFKGTALFLVVEMIVIVTLIAFPSIAWSPL